MWWIDNSMPSGGTRFPAKRRCPARPRPCGGRPSVRKWLMRGAQQMQYAETPARCSIVAGQAICATDEGVRTWARCCMACAPSAFGPLTATRCGTGEGERTAGRRVLFQAGDAHSTLGRIGVGHPVGAAALPRRPRVRGALADPSAVTCASQRSARGWEGRGRWKPGSANFEQSRNTPAGR